MIHYSPKSKVVVAALLLLSLATIRPSFAAQPEVESQGTYTMIKPSSLLLPGSSMEEHQRFTNRLSIHIDDNPQSKPIEPNALVSIVDNRLNLRANKKNILRIACCIYISIAIACIVINIIHNDVLGVIIGLGVVSPGLYRMINLYNPTKSKFFILLGLIFIAASLEVYGVYKRSEFYSRILQ